ncbi:MAG: AmmeMemoRadiSam system radical SAM enzyme [Thermodesulfobacteriota bacterium]
MRDGPPDWLGRPWSRRAFLQSGACALTLLALPQGGAFAQDLRTGFVDPHPALFYDTIAKGLVECRLCPRKCEVKDGERGDCLVRENRGGKYVTLAYGNPCAVHLDPIEKKPLFHVLPGTLSYSIATAGCNLHCKFCQNWEISQTRPEKTINYLLPPAQVVAGAKAGDCPTIAYTYVEPLIFYEYMLDSARLAKKAGILNVCHSAGYINSQPLEKLTEVLDAACIDLKSFDPQFYRDLVGGELAPVLRTLKTLRHKKVHVEIVNLVIPQFNDQPEMLAKMCAWIRDELGPLTPLHFSRFYPLYKMRNHYPTPVSALEKAREIALKAGLKYVYLGNIPANPAESTYCHSCGKMIIQRTGYRIGEVKMKDGACSYCGAKIPGIWQTPQAA